MGRLPASVPRITTSRRVVFRGCRYFVMFRPPSLLTPQIVPTAAILPQGSRGFYVRAYRALLPPHAPDMLTVRRQVIDGTGTCTLLDSQPCRLLQCLDHLFVFNELTLSRAISSYVAYYNHHRPHRSVGQRAPRASGRAADGLRECDEASSQNQCSADCTTFIGMLHNGSHFCALQRRPANSAATSFRASPIFS